MLGSIHATPLTSGWLAEVVTLRVALRGTPRQPSAIIPPAATSLEAPLTPLLGGTARSTRQQQQPLPFLERDIALHVTQATLQAFKKAKRNAHLAQR